jgi:predicted lipoprotein with Yx(FWY)xxD motif
VSAARWAVAVAGLAIGAAACGGSGSGDNATVGTGSGGVNSTGTAAKIGVEVQESAKYGKVLTTLDGRTLYVYSRDTNGKSNCNVAECVTDHKPYLVPAGSAVVQGKVRVLSVIARSDGLKQLALNGRPLYTDAADTSTGQFHGQGEGDVWFIATSSGFTTAGTNVTKTSGGNFPTPPPITGGGYGY